MSETADIRADLSRRLKGKALLIGVGNTLRGDDGAGPAVLALLDGKVNASLLDAGESPESCIGRVRDAGLDSVLLIDAADFGAAPGDLAILEPEDIAHCALSTHHMPLDLFLRFIREESGAADVFALGIQPEHIGFGEPMSPAVADSVRAVAEILQELLQR